MPLRISASLSGGLHWASASKQSAVDVGACEGALVGESEGALVGDGEGAFVGESDGDFVGAFDGALVGSDVVGESEGDFVGENEGALVGEGEGAVVGDVVGSDVVGDVDGALVGCDIKSNSQHTTDATFCIPCASPEWPSPTCVTRVPSGQTRSCASMLPVSAEIVKHWSVLTPQSLPRHHGASHFTSQHFPTTISMYSSSSPKLAS